jgi:hypothetical protein
MRARNEREAMDKARSHFDNVMGCESNVEFRHAKGLTEVPKAVQVTEEVRDDAYAEEE